MVQGGCTHVDVKVGLEGGGGGTYPDFELNLRRVSFRPLDEMGVFNILEGHNKGVKSPLFIFFFSGVVMYDKQILILFYCLTGLSCSKILITFEFLFVEVMVL